MKVTISKSQMLLGLQRIQNVVERRTTIPILSNVLLKTTDNELLLFATDLEVGIQSNLAAEMKEQGAITVKARSLLDIVREMPEGDIYFYSTENNRLEITSGRSGKPVFNILGLPAEDFPEIPGCSTEDAEKFVRMNGAIIMAMLDKTLYAASTDEARYHLNGVYFETLEEDKRRVFRMVATDAHRLALVDSSEAMFDEHAWNLFREGVIVPRKGLNELRRLLSEGKDDFFVAIRGKMLFVKRDGVFLSMRLIEGKYADYRRIIPERAKNPVRVSKEELLSSLKRVSLMATDKSRSVSCQLVPGRLEVAGQSPDIGYAKDEIGVEYSGDELNIGFNSKYLIDAVSSIGGESVLLEFKGKQSPGVIRSADSSNCLSVVMPMRI